MAEEPNGTGWPSARRKPGVRASWDDVLQAEKMGRDLLEAAERRHEEELAHADEQHQIAMSAALSAHTADMARANEKWSRLANEQEDAKAALTAELERANDERAQSYAERDRLTTHLYDAAADAATMRRLVIGALLDSGLTMDDLMHPATPKEPTS